MDVLSERARAQPRGLATRCSMLGGGRAEQGESEQRQKRKHTGAPELERVAVGTARTGLGEQMTWIQDSHNSGALCSHCRLVVGWGSAAD